MTTFRKQKGPIELIISLRTPQLYERHLNQDNRLKLVLRKTKIKFANIHLKLIQVYIGEPQCIIGHQQVYLFMICWSNVNVVVDDERNVL